MHYHLIGICGTAMASLAGNACRRADIKLPARIRMSIRRCQRNSKSWESRFLNGYKAENADIGADCVIVGNTISRGNLELEEVLNRKLLVSFAGRDRQGRIYSRAAFAGRCRERTGRRRRRALRLGWRKSAGLIRRFWSAASCRISARRFRVTDSDFFVIEGDEYDTAYFDKKPKFMHYLARDRDRQQCRI